MVILLLAALTATFLLIVLLQERPSDVRYTGPGAEPWRNPFGMDALKAERIVGDYAKALQRMRERGGTRATPGLPHSVGRIKFAFFAHVADRVKRDRLTEAVYRGLASAYAELGRFNGDGPAPDGASEAAARNRAELRDFTAECFRMKNRKVEGQRQVPAWVFANEAGRASGRG